MSLPTWLRLVARPDLAADAEGFLDLVYEGEFAVRLERQQSALIEEFYRRFPKSRSESRPATRDCILETRRSTRSRLLLAGNVAMRGLVSR